MDKVTLLSGNKAGILLPDINMLCRAFGYPEMNTASGLSAMYKLLREDLSVDGKTLKKAYTNKGVKYKTAIKIIKPLLNGIPSKNIETPLLQKLSNLLLSCKNKNSFEEKVKSIDLSNVEIYKLLFNLSFPFSIKKAIPCTHNYLNKRAKEEKNLLKI